MLVLFQSVCVPSINLPTQKTWFFLSKCLHVWFTTGYSPSCAALSVQEILLIHESTLYRKNLVSTKFIDFIVKLIYNGPTIGMGQLLYFKTIQIHTCYSHLKRPYAKSNTYNILAETWMKARTNTGKQGAEKHVTMYALNFLFYRINMTDSLSALVVLWERSLIYWQPALPAVFLDQSQKHQSGSKVQPSKTSSHSGVCSTRKEWGKVFEAHRNSYEAESNNSKQFKSSPKRSWP